MSSAKKSTSNQLKGNSSLENARKSTQVQTRLRSSNTAMENRNLQPKRSQQFQTLYDGNGRIRQTQEDLCDCFEEDCEGCHFECRKCNSLKCGPICRVNRRCAFETIEYDGLPKIKENPKLFNK